MKNTKKKVGIILYKTEKEKEFEKIRDDAVKKHSLQKGEHTLGHGTTKKFGWSLYQYQANPFRTYRAFDNFLYELSENMIKNDIGFVLGHNDEDGFFWMDYP